MISQQLNPGTYWYEDDSTYDKDPYRDNRLGYDRKHPVVRERATGRIVKFLGIDEKTGKAKVQNVGGRWVTDEFLGKVTKVKITRFNLKRGFLPLPSENFDAVRYTEGTPGVIT